MFSASTLSSPVIRNFLLPSQVPIKGPCSRPTKDTDKTHQNKNVREIVAS
jgi:hypothetical protein